MPGGALGIDAEPSNPLSRATARLFADGMPFSRLSMCFFNGEKSVLRWLGVLVHSAGDRILFFPGYTTAPTDLGAYVGRADVSRAGFIFDHASLEADLKTWHVTTAGSRDHLGSPRTVDLGDSRVLWFGLSVADANALRPVRDQTLVEARIPASDSARRANVFKAARENAQFPLLSLNSDHPAPAGDSFLHFAFVVGAKGFADYVGPEQGFPFGSPFLPEPPPTSRGPLPIRIHRIELSPTMDLQVTCCHLPGKLAVPLAFTGPNPTSPRAGSV